ncbi:MAG: flagellar hook-length control protein FliK [Alphaproteobacteria bacterium]|nr:flagellar hook-length control protein FliK [Alphaproteobacteria bacterium]
MSLSEALFTPTRPASPQPTAARRAEEPASTREEDTSFSEMLDQEDTEETAQLPSAAGASAPGRAAVSPETALMLADLAPVDPAAADAVTSAVSEEIAAMLGAALTVSGSTSPPLEGAGLVTASTGPGLVSAPPSSPIAPAAALDTAAGPGAARAEASASSGSSDQADTPPSSGQKTANPGTSLSKETTGAAINTGSGGVTPPSQAASQTPALTPDLSALASSPLDGQAGASPSGAALSGQGPAASAATPASPAHPALAQAPAAAVQVYVRFVERFDGRAQQFNIRLDPAELGRVDVRIEIGADQKVHAVLAAHDSAALSDLIRGSKALEQALASSGVDLADGGLRFELSDDRQDRSGSGSAQTGDSNDRRNRSGAERLPPAVQLGDSLRGPQPSTPGLLYSWRPARLNLLA